MSLDFCGKAEKKMFERFCSEYFLKDALISNKESLDIIPKRSQRQIWDNVDGDIKDYYIQKAQKIAQKPIPMLTASGYMEYAENGNRTNYEDPYHLRRNELTSLLIAECCENEGRFIKTILDYVYCICDEFSWVVPAHNNQMYLGKIVDCLPKSVNFDLVDLFAGETASVLSWAVYLFGDEFDKISPYINERVKYEIDRRIFKPFLSGSEMPWMGYKGHVVNNWVPWIISNCIPAAHIFADDVTKVTLMQKFMGVLDRFIAEYKPDGGCDEGPGYWNAAGASLFDALEILYSISNGKIDVYSEPLIKNIGKYIMHAHLFDRIFINFADGSPSPVISAELINRYGRRVNSTPLASFGARMFDTASQKDPNRFFCMRTIKNALNFSKMKKFSEENTSIEERQTYLQYLQVGVSRDVVGKIITAFKGGNNCESHNHNDVGCFVVYKDKKPVIIDAGVEEYTAKTFSDERYTIWTMQSVYHNLPTIAGYMQSFGKQYKAENVSCTFGHTGCEFSLNAENAYPQEAGVKSFERDIVHEYGKEGYFELTDTVSLLKPESVEFNLTLADEPEVSDSKLSVNGAEICFESGAYSVKIEAIPLDDKKIIADWQGRKSLYRAVFTPKAVKADYVFKLRIV